VAPTLGRASASLRARLPFKTVRWPSFWYDVLRVVDTVGRFPELWSAPDSREADRTAIAELAACLIAYNMDSEGRVTPRRVHRGYEAFSFGVKDAPSAFATAQVLAGPLTGPRRAHRSGRCESLTSSKGGTDAHAPARALGGAVPGPRDSGSTRSGGSILTPSLGHREPHVSRSSPMWWAGGNSSRCRFVLAARIPAATIGATRARQAPLARRWRCMRGLLMVVRCDFVDRSRGHSAVAKRSGLRPSRGMTPEAYGDGRPRAVRAVRHR
jgi:hypothetical protein